MTRFVVALAAITMLAPPSTAAAAPAATCTEDQACWDWTQMGNRQRRVVTVEGESMVAGTCSFQKLWYAKRIRYSGPGRHIKRLKGDAWARRYGCGFDVQNY